MVKVMHYSWLAHKSVVEMVEIHGRFNSFMIILTHEGLEASILLI
jgi:hypothetical protein